MFKQKSKLQEMLMKVLEACDLCASVCNDTHELKDYTLLDSEY